MNIKMIVKKYSILVIVAVLFVSAIVYFAMDSNKGIIKGKNANGKDVVVSLKGYNLIADDLYDEMMNKGAYGSQYLYMFYERAVVSAVGKKTDDMQSSAEVNRDSIINDYKTQYGDVYQDYLKMALYNSGIKTEKDIVEYYVNYYMLQQMIADYVDENLETLFAPYFKEMKPRYVSHILVKCADPKNPTAEEKQKMADVDAALAKGTAFVDVAKEYSDDGSAATGGDLGYVTSETSFVEPFLKAMLELGNGEQTKWVETEFGFHIIKVDECREAEMMKTDDAYSALVEYYPNIQIQVVANAAKDLDIKFANEEIQTKIENFIKQYTED